MSTITIFFPDISAFQPGISLAGAVAVCSKASEGTGWASGCYGAQKAEAIRRGAMFTAYHFLHPGNAGGQAVYCHSIVGNTPLMLDVEASSGGSPQIGDVTAFIDAYRKCGGTCFYTYLPHWYWQGHMASCSLAPLDQRGMLLWSSAYTAYTDADSGLGWQPYGGMYPSIWQYSDATPFNGLSIDFNAYRGTHPGDQSPAAVKDTLAQLRSLFTTGRMPAMADKASAAPAPPGIWKEAILAGRGSDGNLYEASFSADTGKWTAPAKKV